MITGRYPLQWNKNKIALCACFVDCYFAKTSPCDLWKAGENPFNVKNLDSPDTDIQAIEMQPASPEAVKKLTEY
jgi:hypothetical protein